MATQIDLRQIERNIWRDYCQDGLGDVLLGAYLLLVGLGLLVGTVAPFVVPIVFYAPLLRHLKKRVTHPRTGYVELRQGDPQPLLRFLLGSLVLGLVALVATLIAAGIIAQPAQWYRWMPIFFGIWLAGIFLGLALRVRLVRYYVLAAIALAAGPTVALLSLAGKLAHIGLFLVVVGATLLAWGVGALIRFLRQHPRPVEEGDYGQG